jgi:hypothetical protein
VGDWRVPTNWSRSAEPIKGGHVSPRSSISLTGADIAGELEAFLATAHTVTGVRDRT